MDHCASQCGCCVSCSMKYERQNPDWREVQGEWEEYCKQVQTFLESQYFSSSPVPW